MNDLSYLKSWLRSRSVPCVSESRAQGLQEELEEYFAYFFDSSKDGISVLALDYTVLAANTAMERWFRERLPLCGCKCYAVFHDREGPCEDCPTVPALRTGKPQIGVVPYERSGPLRGTHEFSIFPLYDDDNRIFALLEIVRDLTDAREERQVEESLKKRILFHTQDQREREIALDALFRQENRAERRLAVSLLSNMGALIEPLIARMKNRASGLEEQNDLELLSTRLRSIASPFVQALSIAERGLTNRELEIASLVREGKSTKEIADALGVSLKTVDYHRANLRRKLGLASSDERLQSYLARVDRHHAAPDG